jgi:hypothetical protein
MCVKAAAFDSGAAKEFLPVLRARARRARQVTSHFSFVSAADVIHRRTRELLRIERGSARIFQALND